MAASRPAWLARHHGLDATAARYGGPGKTDDLKALAEGSGKAAGFRGRVAARDAGFGLIPRNHPDSIAYLRGDVAATSAIFWMQCPEGTLTDYQLRELRACGRLSHGISLVGFRIDRQEVERRVAATQATLDAGVRKLEAIGMPRREERGDGFWSSPHSIKAGKEAIARHRPTEAHLGRDG